MLANRLESCPIATKPRRWLFVCVVAGVLALSAFSPTASGQEQTEPHKAYFKTIPLRGNTPEQAARESASGRTILTWTYNITSPKDGNVYTGQIMGAKWPTIRDPTPGVETIPTYVVPLILNIWDGTKWVKFDPTATDNTCASGNKPLTLVENSPLFQFSHFNWNGVNLGTTQYIDALQRASFWTVGGSSTPFGDIGYWHNYFGLHTTLPITVNVPTQTGPMVQNAPCGQIGIISLAWLDLYVTSNIIPSLQNLGVNPTTFPIILTYNVVQRDDATGTCCILGYHSAYGSPLQVYAVSMFDTTGDFGNSQDITALSHELGETMNDPFASNATPTWGNEGQYLGLNNCDVPPVLEVGDPLTGTLYPPITLHGYTYHPQELAMAGWFLDGWLPTLNWGIKDWFSSNGTFQGPACVCPPGGHHLGFHACGP